MASQSLISLEQKTLDNTVGAVFLGVVGASILYGITIVQAYFYYHRFRHDTLLHKGAVALLCALDTLHEALIIHAVYQYIVTGFGNMAGLSTILWSIKLQVLIGVAIVLMVHSLYTYRVWLLSGYHRGVLGYLVAVVVIVGFAIGIVFTYYIYMVHTFPELDKVSWAITTSLSTSTSIDFVIAAAMCFYLRKSKGQETVLNTRISRVMQYTLGSGLVTSACSLAALFTYTLLPDTFVFVGIEFLLTKLYVGSFLAMLNARERPRHKHRQHPQQANNNTTTSTSSFDHTTDSGMPVFAKNPHVPLSDTCDSVAAGTVGSEPRYKVSLPNSSSITHVHHEEDDGEKSKKKHNGVRASIDTHTTHAKDTTLVDEYLENENDVSMMTIVNPEHPYPELKKDEIVVDPIIVGHMNMSAVTLPQTGLTIQTKGLGLKGEGEVQWPASQRQHQRDRFWESHGTKRSSSLFSSTIEELSPVSPGSVGSAHPILGSRVRFNSLNSGTGNKYYTMASSSSPGSVGFMTRGSSGYPGYGSFSPSAMDLESQVVRKKEEDSWVPPPHDYDEDDGLGYGFDFILAEDEGRNSQLLDEEYGLGSPRSVYSNSIFSGLEMGIKEPEAAISKDSHPTVGYHLPWTLPKRRPTPPIMGPPPNRSLPSQPQPSPLLSPHSPQLVSQHEPQYQNQNYERTIASHVIAPRPTPPVLTPAPSSDLLSHTGHGGFM